MTWAEIKTAIEAKGVKDEDVVNYIDIAYDDNIIASNDGIGSRKGWNIEND